MTILYLSDWQSHKGAIIDIDTPNKSFVRYSALLKSMGVKNHAFPLALYNPELQGVDPFDPNLSMEQMMAIAIEAKQNFWFFLRSISRVPGTGHERQYIKANRGNIALFWLFLNHITMFLIQPRQTGKSFSTDVLMSWLLNVASTDTYIAMLTKDETLRSRALTRLKDIIDELPFYLKQRTKKDVANTEEITIKKLDNRYKGLLPSKSPKSALNVGRGLTAPVFHVDEIAFIYNIEITLPAALPATTTARNIAEAKGEPYGNIFTTTAGKKDDKDGKFVYQQLCDSATWSEQFLDAANEEELHTLIRNSSPSGQLKVNCTFNHRQLGYTDQWLKETLELTGSKGEDADRDYFNIWTAGSQSSPFPVDVAETIRKSEVPDPAIEIAKPYNYVTRWYIPLEDIERRMVSSNYILGVDTSDAVGFDDIAMVLRDIRTGEVVAAANVNETNLIIYTKWLASWLIKYPTVTLIIERRSSGIAIIDLLLLILVENGINPFKRMYNKVVQEKEEKPDRFIEVDKRFTYNAAELINKYKATFGFATSGSGITSRSELYSTTLTNSVKTTATLVKDKKIIDQMLGLVIRNGRVDHEDGGHDDLCFTGETLVRTINGNKPMADLKLGDLVLTRMGYKPIINIFVNKRDVITKFGITGTPDHPFITPTGEVPFKNLTLKSEVYVWNEKLSRIMVKTIIDTLSLKELTSEIISIGMIRIMNLLLPCIDKCGRMNTGRFQKEKKFIIKIKSLQITILKILNVYLQQNIDKSTLRQKKLDKNLERTQKNETLLVNGEKKIQTWLKNMPKKMEVKAKVLLTGGKIILNWLAPLQKNLVKNRLKLEQKRELSLPASMIGEKITQNWLNKFLEIMGLKITLLTSGGKITPNWPKSHLIPGEKITQNWLNRRPKLLLKNLLKPELKKELVYNLTVADCHEYFVNDILVHNCIGFLLSYWLMTQGKNLHYYNIPIKDILINNHVTKTISNNDDRYEAIRQKQVQEEITDLVETIQAEKNDYLIFKYENRLKKLASELNSEEAIHSIDKLIENLRESKKINRKINNGFRGYSNF